MWKVIIKDWQPGPPNRCDWWFNKAKRSHRSKDWQEYKKHKKHTLQSIRHAHWNYVNSIHQDGLESNDSKPFWRYVKSNQQDSVGVSPLKSVGKLYAEAKDKADILNKQFKSVFTPPQSRTQKSLL